MSVNLGSAFPSEASAVAALEAAGFAKRASASFWHLRSTTGGSLTDAPHPTVALAAPVRNVVAPEYGKDYWTVSFY